MPPQRFGNNSDEPLKYISELLLTMSKIKGAIVVDEERCKGCNLCVVACPTHTLALTTNEVNHRGYVYCHDVADACIGCTSCAIVCPDACITVYKKKMD